MYTLITDGDISDTARVTVEVIDSTLFNRALEQTCDTSSIAEGFPPDSAFDGKLETLWKSSGGNTEWICVDLGRQLRSGTIRAGRDLYSASSFRRSRGKEENGPRQIIRIRLFLPGG